MGGTVLLESYLHELAKIRSYDRLGKNVRAQLMAELKRLARKKVLVIEEDIVRLL